MNPNEPAEHSAFVLHWFNEGENIMIKSLIGAAIGSSLTKSAPVAGGAAGAAIASAVPAVIARLSIPTMIAVGVGGYFLKRHFDKRDEESGSDQSASAGKTAKVPANPPRLTGAKAGGSKEGASAPAVASI
jgi:hypothetical protein